MNDMNDDQVTALLERLVRNVDVPQAPVASVSADGRRRLHRRRWGVAGTAAAVALALAVAGVVVDRAVLTNANPGPASLRDSLIGAWRPVRLDGQPVNESDTLRFSLSGNRLAWGANQDCNRGGGFAAVGPAGRFRITQATVTQVGCLADAYTPFDAVTHAHRVSVAGQRLTLWAAMGRELGVFIRVGTPLNPAISARLPGLVPNAAELAGRWHWVTTTPPQDPGSTFDPSTLTLSRHSMAHPHVVLSKDKLSWEAEVGCNNVASGVLAINPEGEVTTAQVSDTGFLCEIGPPPGQTFIPTIVTRAAWVRLVNGRLDFFNRAGHVTASFRRLGADGQHAQGTSSLDCTAWLSDGLRTAIEGRYGEIDDCQGVLIPPASGEWVLTTDEGAGGIGYIGIYVCPAGDCAGHTPKAASDITWYQPNTTRGTYDRFAGVNDDGTLVFLGGDVHGEMALDVSTGVFDSELNHE